MTGRPTLSTYSGKENLAVVDGKDVLEASLCG